jgi:hypothetical protein
VRYIDGLDWAYIFGPGFFGPGLTLSPNAWQTGQTETKRMKSALKSACGTGVEHHLRPGGLLHAGAASLPKVYSKSVISSGRQVKIASYAALLSGCEEFPFLV